MTKATQRKLFQIQLCWRGLELREQSTSDLRPNLYALDTTSLPSDLAHNFPHLSSPTGSLHSAWVNNFSTDSVSAPTSKRPHLHTPAPNAPNKPTAPKSKPQQHEPTWLPQNNTTAPPSRAWSSVRGSFWVLWVRCRVFWVRRGRAGWRRGRGSGGRRRLLRGRNVSFIVLCLVDGKSWIEGFVRSLISGSMELTCFDFSWGGDEEGRRSWCDRLMRISVSPSICHRLVRFLGLPMGIISTLMTLWWR